MNDALGDFLILLATVDPVSTLALFVGLTARLSDAERRAVAFRSVGYSTGILMAFLIVGQVALNKLGVSLASFQLAGAVIFFLFGVQMVFGTGAGATDQSPEAGHDIAVFPLAVPSIATPGSILATVVLTDNERFTWTEQAVTAGLLLGVMAITLVALLMANPIYRLIGRAGASLVVRVLGLILASLAVEMGVGALRDLIGAG